jgi:iron complex transport system ATP-binding protein
MSHVQPPRAGHQLEPGAGGDAPAAWQTAPPARLEVEGLSLHAGGGSSGRLLFGGLDLQVEPGQCWAVLGPNGAGKSSLLAALAGVLAAGAGAISIDGRTLRDWPPPALARRRAWCPQFWSDPFAATVTETAMLAMPGAGRPTGTPEAAPPAVRQVLHRLDLTALRAADVRHLSGGERQRVAIATTLLQGAPLLLLDEPLSHLDLWHQQGLLGLLHEHAANGGSVVASLHDLNLAWDLATHAVLIDGRGRAWAGERSQVLAPDRLGDVFGVPIHRVAVCGEERFWVGPAGGDLRPAGRCSA